MTAFPRIVLCIGPSHPGTHDLVYAIRAVLDNETEPSSVTISSLTEADVRQLHEQLEITPSGQQRYAVLRAATIERFESELLFISFPIGGLKHLHAWTVAVPDLRSVLIVPTEQPADAVIDNQISEALRITATTRRIVLPAKTVGVNDRTRRLLRWLLNEAVESPSSLTMFSKRTIQTHVSESLHVESLRRSIQLREQSQLLKERIHRKYMPGSSAADASSVAFDEDLYLYYNRDVAAAVSTGQIASGRDHWLHDGHKELRAGGTTSTLPDRRLFLHEMQARPYGVNAYGFLSTASRLGTVARGCVRALNTRGVPVLPVDVPPWPETRVQRLAPRARDRYRINLILQNTDMMPLFVNAYGTDVLEGSYNIGLWFWELPVVRSDWYPNYEYVDEIWVASEFCRQSFQALTSLPVTRVPLVVADLEKKATYPREHFGFAPGVFVFGYVFDINSSVVRKNPFCLIDAFRKEFGDSEDVLLYLKYSNGGPDNPYAQAIQEAVAGAPNIRTYDGILTDEEIVSLHKAVDCFVSPHRSEGFGYNMAETMYFGKPVIATRYSSNLDFMNDANSYLIDYRLIPIAETAGSYVAGYVWADPLRDHLQSLLREVFEDEEGRAKKGRRAAADIREKYSAEAAGRAMTSRFEELGLDQRKLKASLIHRPFRGPEGRFVHPDAPAVVVDQIRGLRHKPVISVITPVYNVEARWLKRCIESVRAQWYPYWELCLCDDASTRADTIEVLENYRGIDPRIRIVRSETNCGIAAASNRSVEISSGEYVAMLDNDDEITPDCLFEIAKAIAENGPADLLYTDEDKIEEDGTFSDHYFKPDFSPEHLRSVMYFLHMLVVRKEVFYAAGGFRDEFSGSQDYDLTLRVSEVAQRIVHVPKVLYHWRKIEGSAAAVVDAKPAALVNGSRALQSHIDRCHLDASVEDGKLPGLFRVKHRIIGDPLVSLLIIAGDGYKTVPGRGEISLVAHTARSIATQTSYPNFELVIVADGELSERTLKNLTGVPHRLVQYEKPSGPFNFSRKVNFAFSRARGQHVVLLNDDLEVISAEWLSAMLEFSQQQDIGAVGARLLLPDGRIQHVGIAVGVNGGATHLYHGYPADFVGYNGYTHLIRNYSAVTGACLATRMDVFERTGGFDEQLAIDYNDIDFCLRVLESGYRIVYTPYAELYHFEGTSLKRTSQDPKEVALFSSRWDKYIRNDPYYNPNLTRNGVDFSLSEAADWPRKFRSQRQTQLAVRA